MRNSFLKNSIKAKVRMHLVGFVTLGHEKQLQNLQKTYENNKQTQIKLIKQGFDQIIEALVKKKESLISETEEKYDNEIGSILRFSQSTGSKMKHINEINEEVENLKSMSIEGDKSLVITKAKKIKEFNNKFVEMINHQKKLVKQSSKLDEIEHSNRGYENISKEFTPVTIDSTSAIAYITNMALSSQSIISNKFNVEVDSPPINPYKSNKSLGKMEEVERRNNQAISSPIKSK